MNRICKVCEQEKDISQFSNNGERHIHTCISCHNKSSLLNYEDSMKNEIFIKKERARRLEKYYRRQHEKYCKQLLELNKRKDETN